MQRLSKLWTRVDSAVRDLRYGALLGGGRIPSRFSDEGAIFTVSSRYRAYPILFDGLVRDDDVLVDVGCGKGRVINWWLSKYRANRIYGLEIDPDIASATARRLRRYRNVVILSGDASSLLPADGSLFFMFEAFHGPMMMRFISAMKKLPPLGDYRKRKLIYYNCPRSKHLFIEDGGFKVQDIPIPEGFSESALIEVL
jgi:SAM-dependent methyltransferase